MGEVPRARLLGLHAQLPARVGLQPAAEGRESLLVPLSSVQPLPEAVPACVGCFEEKRGCEVASVKGSFGGIGSVGGEGNLGVWEFRSLRCAAGTAEGARSEVLMCSSRWLLLQWDCERARAAHPLCHGVMGRPWQPEQARGG